jgi:hypothetical protein
MLICTDMHVRFVFSVHRALGGFELGPETSRCDQGLLCRSELPHRSPLGPKAAGFGSKPGPGAFGAAQASGLRSLARVSLRLGLCGGGTRQPAHGGDGVSRAGPE